MHSYPRIYPSHIALMHFDNSKKKCIYYLMFGQVPGAHWVASFGVSQRQERNVGEASADCDFMPISCMTESYFQLEG